MKYNLSELRAYKKQLLKELNEHNKSIGVDYYADEYYYNVIVPQELQQVEYLLGEVA